MAEKIRIQRIKRSLSGAAGKRNRMDNRQIVKAAKSLFGLLQHILGSQQASGSQSSSRQKSGSSRPVPNQNGQKKTGKAGSQSDAQQRSRPKKIQEQPACRGKNESALPGSLQQLAARYEKELMDRTFLYTFEADGQTFQAPVEFEAGNFCHLFSIGSMVGRTDENQEEYAGMKGWNNVRSGKISYDRLKKLDPEEFEYYAREHGMFDQMKETVNHPQAVRYIAKNVPGSKLQADILLYRIFGSQTVHIALSRNNRNEWFPRSYFVRDVSKEKAYPTKYICSMPELGVSVKVKRR